MIWAVIILGALCAFLFFALMACAAENMRLNALRDEDARDERWNQSVNKALLLSSTALQARALIAAAEAWGTIEEQARLREMSLHYKPDGPSMPELWLRDRAERML